MKTIIMDTNFLLIPYQFKVDIFSEIDRIVLERYELFVLDKTIEELEKIIKGKGQKQRNKLAATLALQLVRSKNIGILKTESGKTVDDILLEKADKDTIIATQDIELKHSIKQKNCTLIVLRAKKYLILV